MCLGMYVFFSELCSLCVWYQSVRSYENKPAGVFVSGFDPTSAVSFIFYCLSVFNSLQAAMQCLIHLNFFVAIVVNVTGYSVYTPWAIKTCHFYFFNNSGKYWRIFIIFHNIFRKELWNKSLLKFSPHLKSVAALLVELEMLSVLIYNNATTPYSIQNWRKMSSHSTNT